MPSPIALVLDDDRSVRERARDALRSAGIDAVDVATPHDALLRLRENPLAIVVAVVGESSAPVRRTVLEELLRLRADFDGPRQVPSPLREGPGDTPVLVREIIDELRRLNRLPPLAVAPDAMAALERFPWSGDVAKLRSAVESAVMLASDGVVRLRDLPEAVRNNGPAAAPDGLAGRRFREAKRVVVEAFERSYLEDLLKRHGGNVTGAAEQSGMLRSALQRLLRKHELHSADFRHRDATTPYAT